MTVAEVIRKGGPSRPTIYRILNDSGYEPEVYSIERLCTVMGLSSKWLLVGDGPMFESRAAEAATPYQVDDGLTPAQRIVLRTVRADILKLSDQDLESWFERYQASK